MKMQRSILFIVSGLLILASCSKKDTTPTISYKSPSTAHTQITVPAGLQTQATNGNINAVMAVTYIQLANGLGQYASAFTLGSGEASTSTSNGSIYTWSYGGTSVWMTYSVLSDKYTWTEEWKTPEIARFTYIQAEEMKDGSSGNWKIYYPDSANHPLAWDYSWTLSGSVFNATTTFHGSTTQDVQKFVVVDNGNNSGSFQYFEGTVKKIEVIWKTDGTGTYWFAGEGTNPPTTGSWTATG